ncbi:hypothetical protein LCGC14_1478490 [marine sediment metagenome]|uniref:Uncharacterized protein n=1 Tax=marine sediment metagenome TaxID=412755 RepID=A0A0F9MBW5_9ZZZZ
MVVEVGDITQRILLKHTYFCDTCGKVGIENIYPIHSCDSESLSGLICWDCMYNHGDKGELTNEG